MSNPEFDNLRRQFCYILRASAATFRSSALAVEQYANIIEAGGIPSAHDIQQISAQLPQVPNTGTGKSKKKGKDHDGDHAMFEALHLPGEDGDSKKRKRGAKKARDPNAPKRPPSAYLLYQNSVRADTKAKNPEMTYPELLAQISKQWADLTEEEKKPFIDATAVAKEQYDEDKAKYDAEHPPAGGTDAAVVAPVAAAAAPSPSEDSDVESPVIPAPVVVPTKSPKNKPAEKASNKSPPKDKKKAAPPPVQSSSSGSDDDASDEEKSEEEEKEPPRKKAKKGKSPPPAPAKKETKAKGGRASKAK